MKRGIWNVARDAQETWERLRGRRVFFVLVNESRVYERRIAAATEEQALQTACRLISERGNAAGWREVGRYYRNVRTRRR